MPVAKSRTDVFFDTNILVYAASANPKSTVSERLLRAGGVVSVQVLNEFAAVALRKLQLTIAEIRHVLEAVRAVCVVVPMTIEMHDRGLEIAERYKLHVYDATIMAAADLAGCGVVYSEDMQDGFAAGGVRVRNPYDTG